MGFGISPRLLIFGVAAGSWLLASESLYPAPIHDAAQAGDLAGLQRLIDEGAAVDDGAGLDGVGGYTPLFVAVREGHTHAVEYLIGQGANVNVRLSGSFFTPLWEAAWNGEVEIAKLLIDHGAEVDVRDRIAGRTPLHGAARMSRIEITELLVRAGADINARNDDGETPLLYALGDAPVKPEQVSQIAELLIEHGADLTVRDTRLVQTPLHVASTWGLDRVVELLIEKGADLDARDARGFTPVHGAASLRRLNTAQLLIDAGADIHARTEGGVTPLHFAAAGGDTRLVELLIAAGAELNAETADGRTPFNFASARGQMAVIQLLQSHGAEQQAVCVTADDIEAMNRGGIRRLFELEGVDAKVFLALDPRLTGEFEDAFTFLMQQDIDRIVAWRLTGSFGLATAVPFVGDCAAEGGYGEPDILEKIQTMRSITRLIARRGAEDARVRARMQDLFDHEPLAPSEDRDEIVDLLVGRVAGIHASSE